MQIERSNSLAVVKKSFGRIIKLDTKRENDLLKAERQTEIQKAKKIYAHALESSLVSKWRLSFYSEAFQIGVNFVQKSTVATLSVLVSVQWRPRQIAKVFSIPSNRSICDRRSD